MPLGVEINLTPSPVSINCCCEAFIASCVVEALTSFSPSSELSVVTTDQYIFKKYNSVLSRISGVIYFCGIALIIWLLFIVFQLGRFTQKTDAE